MIKFTNKTNFILIPNEVINKLSETKFNYPYSVLKILNKENKTINDNDFDIFTKNLEQYFQVLNNKYKIKPEDIATTSVSLYEKSEIIRQYIINTDIKAKDTKEFNQEIKTLLKENSITAIKKDITINNLTNSFLNNYDKTLKFENCDDIKTYILSLISNYEFTYSDNIFKFFLELDYQQAFKFRKTISTRNLKFSYKRFFILINDFNNLFQNVCDLFERDSNFAYNFVKSSYFNNHSNFKMFVTDSLIFEKPSERYSDTMITYFFNGWMNLRNFYLLNFENLNNYSYGLINDFNDKELHDLFKKIIKIFDDECINTIYKIRNLSYNDILENSDLLKRIYHFESCLKDTKIKIRKQQLNDENNTIIENIKNTLNNYTNEENNPKIENIVYHEYQIGIKADLLNFEINYNNTKYKVKITQLNLQLFFYIYIEKKLIYKDRIFRTNDFDRLFYIIKEYSNNHS